MSLTLFFVSIYPLRLKVLSSPWLSIVEDPKSSCYLSLTKRADKGNWDIFMSTRKLYSKRKFQIIIQAGIFRFTNFDPGTHDSLLCDVGQWLSCGRFFSSRPLRWARTHSAGAWLGQCLSAPNAIRMGLLDAAKALPGSFRYLEVTLETCRRIQNSWHSCCVVEKGYHVQLCISRSLAVNDVWAHRIHVFTFILVVHYPLQIYCIQHHGLIALNWLHF